jgi:hypothetical protein
MSLGGASSGPAGTSMRTPRAGPRSWWDESDKMEKEDRVGQKEERGGG